MRTCLAAACVAIISACGPSQTAAPASAPAATTAEASAGWAANLTDLLPFIDACLAKSPDTRWVSYAGRTGEGLVTVRLSGAAGEFDCTVPDDDPRAEHAALAPRRDELHIEGEGAEIFVRAPGENPGGECYTAPEVRGSDGALLGWMADPAGC